MELNTSTAIPPIISENGKKYNTGLSNVTMKNFMELSLL